MSAAFRGQRTFGLTSVRKIAANRTTKLNSTGSLRRPSSKSCVNRLRLGSIFLQTASLARRALQITSANGSRDWKASIPEDSRHLHPSSRAMSRRCALGASTWPPVLVRAIKCWSDRLDRQEGAGDRHFESEERTKRPPIRRSFHAL